MQSDSPQLDPSLTTRYMLLLGVSRRKPSLQALTELVAAQMIRIPFENISKLLYKKRSGLSDLPPIDMYLEGVEKHHFGGTCYSNNFRFYQLLISLGYNAKLCAADMAEKDIHAASMVQLEGAEYLIDVGYAAPFLNPLPRSLKTNYVVELGWDRYVLKPQDPHGRSRLELHRGGTLKHGYMVKPEPRTFRDFKGVIKSSFRANATFLNSILLARFYPGRSVVIHNLSLIQSCGGQSEVRRLANLNGVVEAAEEHFEMPGSLVAESIKDLSQLQDAWSDLSSGGRSRT